LPNLSDLKIQQLLLYFAPSNGTPAELNGVRLQFSSQTSGVPVGGSASTIDGVISTRRPSGSNWLPITGNIPPIGEWELALPADDSTRKLIANEEIQDILFVITYSGNTPEWPES
jgi:hypothetical protein